MLRDKAVWKKPHRWHQLQRGMPVLVRWPDHWKEGEIVALDLVSEDRSATVKLTAGGHLDVELLDGLRIPVKTGREVAPGPTISDAPDPQHSEKREEIA